MIGIIVDLLVGVVIVMVSAPTFSQVFYDIKKYINVIDRNFVTRLDGKRKLHESTLAAQQLIESDPEVQNLIQALGHSKTFQKFANNEKDEELMSQCSFLFSKQVDAWHINNFWYVKLIINRQLDKLDKRNGLKQHKLIWLKK